MSVRRILRMLCIALSAMHVAVLLAAGWHQALLGYAPIADVPIFVLVAAEGAVVFGFLAFATTWGER